jgi:hypothetical protein
VRKADHCANMHITSAQNIGAECNIGRLATDRGYVVLQSDCTAFGNLIA